ncbi:hypothetical protein EUTSA_v10022870mg [Eutrema salsugineum]|uniref:Uncharacterized protein n=1 Tax=Eutrema salsugineum TaxID=72664 RepID=V4MDI2_EUTSA|nr:uncharacterized protein LOC18026030 [Eutrema salsugineum]ESQ50533.1 hypothetical protein EUTSA_v10022870mg [Eutrema salsugineum]
MSRLLTKTLIPHGRLFLRRFNEPAIAAPNVVCFSRRPFSSKPQLIEIDLDSSSSATSKAEAEAAILKKLNEFVRRIIVQNSTPDWLPFAPGSSFWVPPHQNTAAKIANLVDKVTNPLTEEESLSLYSPNGCPCSSFFIPPDHDSSSTKEVEVSMELNIPGNEMLEVKLAHFPDPIYSFKHGDSDDEE